MSNVLDCPSTRTIAFSIPKKKSTKWFRKLARTYSLASLGPEVDKIGQVDETGYRLKETGFETSSFELYTDFHDFFAMYTEVR